MQFTLKYILIGISILIITFIIIRNIKKTTKYNKNKSNNSNNYTNINNRNNCNNTNIDSKFDTELDIIINNGRNPKLCSNPNSNSKPSQVNLITSLNRKKYIDNPTDYYTKKKNVRFEDDPVEKICEDPIYNAEDEFLKKYVFNSQFYCKDELNASYKEDSKNHASYRDDFYDFRGKTQQLSNEYSPVDAINDMIVGNDSYDNMPVNEIYDKLTANQYKSI